MTKAIPAITVLDEFGDEVRSRQASLENNLAAKPWPSNDADMPTLFHRKPGITREEYAKLLKISAILDEGHFRLYKYMDTREMTSMTAVKLDLTKGAQSCFNEKDVTDFCSQVARLRVLKHPRLARYYGTYCNDHKVVFFREYLPRGSVYDKLLREGIPETVAAKYFRQACEGLQFLHSHRVVHGRVAATSLLLCINDDVKLADYGLFVNSVSQCSRIASLKAPEDNGALRLSAARDIWCLGAVLVMMCERTWLTLPYGNRKAECDIVDWYGSVSKMSSSEDVKELAYTCLRRDPRQRPTTYQILEMDAVQRNASMPSSILSFRRANKEVGRENAGITTQRRRNSDVTSERNSTRMTSQPKERLPAYGTSGLLYSLAFMGSRLLLFLLMMLKWSLMIFVVSLALGCMASFIFFSIFVIYRAIRVLCQCELNEGFVVLIAIILLPILILLTTLCCNNASDRYERAVRSGRIHRANFHVDLPDDDLVICGVKVMDGAKSARIKAERAKAADEKRKSETEEFDHKIKGSIQRAIAEIA